jgi:hypothetical protein
LSTLEKNFSPWFIFIRLSRSYNLDSEFFSLFSIDLNLFWLFFIFFLILFFNIRLIEKWSS